MGSDGGRLAVRPATGDYRSSARPAFDIFAIEPGICFLLDIDEQVSGTIVGCRRLLKRRGSLCSDKAGRVNDTKSWDVASHIA
ncbi:MAG: hypothetical protein EOO81_09785 [Oxalobacteraceae bacterium]|nr:MAG: hypothetical protein EOO81_09785 [Oxalobacteraceae bacterium]